MVVSASHGRYTIKREGNVVHTYPVGGFNDLGIIRIRESILEAASGCHHWILLEHPCNKAGLTPAAVKEIIRSFEMFKASGCIGIAMEVESTWAWAMNKELKEELGIPLYFNDDHSKTQQWALQQLEELCSEASH